MNQDAQIDKIVEQHRAADVDAEYDETITDVDYPEPEPRDRINPAVAFGAALSDLLSVRRFNGLITFGFDPVEGKPTIHLTADYFNRHLADNWTVTEEAFPSHGFVEKQIDFEPCKIFCIESCKFVRAKP